jgi:hypothetical protein
VINGGGEYYGHSVCIKVTEKEAIMLAGYLQAMASDKIARRRL